MFVIKVILVIICATVTFGETINGDEGYTAERIIGGKLSKISKYPYTVAVYVDGYLNGAGAILNNQWVIGSGFSVSTADSAANVTVRVASSGAYKGGLVKQVKRFVVHPKLRGWDHDMALLQLKTPLRRNTRNAKSIQLGSHLPKSGQKTIFTGYGSRQNESTPGIELVFDGLFKEIELPYMPYKECVKYHNATLFFTKNNFCTKTEYLSSPYARDFGGPLVYKKKLIGLFAGAPRCSGVIKPAVYADVTREHKWIKSTIKKYSHLQNLEIAEYE
uniref:Trypsin-like serine protein n=1 Tax=Nilaparvata lugens TaxID=108931 RepID=F8UV65_NILLU|nr:trypsin-like serine protein [Nilaparvata lugens]